MSGSIIPTPLAMPTTRAGRRRPWPRRPWATVSVVMIPVAAADGVGAVERARHRRRRRRAGARAGSAGRSRRSTPRARRRASTRAARPRRRRAPRRRRGRRRRWRRWRSSTRRRSAWARPSARCSRLIVTLGPAKRLRVNTPAAATGRPARDDHEVVGVVLHADVGDVAAEALRERDVVSWLGVGRPVADGPEDPCHRLDVARVEAVDDVPAHALDVRGSDPFEVLPAGVGEHGEHHPPIGRRRPPLDQPGAHEAVEPPGEPAGRQLQARREVAHPQLVVVGLGQVAPAPGSRRASRPCGAEVGLEGGVEVDDRLDVGAPRRHLSASSQRGRRSLSRRPA